MLKRFVIACVTCGILAGCAAYYRVSDLTTEKQYYTQEITEKRNGAVVFKDSRTGNQITLTSTEVAKVSKEEFTYGGKEGE